MRLNNAKQKVVCHRKKLDEIAEELGAAANALSDPNLRIVNMNNKNLLTSGGFHIDYPSQGEVIATFKEYEQAVKEQDSALEECHRLNLSSF